MKSKNRLSAKDDGSQRYNLDADAVAEASLSEDITLSEIEKEFSLSDDLLRGVKAISEFIGEDERRTFYLAEKGYIPLGKEGATWIGSKKTLRAHYAKITGGQP